MFRKSFARITSKLTAITNELTELVAVEKANIERSEGAVDKGREEFCNFLKAETAKQDASKKEIAQANVAIANINALLGKETPEAESIEDKVANEKAA